MNALKTITLTIVGALHAVGLWIKRNPIELQILFVIGLIIVGGLRLPSESERDLDGRVIIAGDSLKIDTLENTFAAYGYRLGDIRSGEKNVPRLIIAGVPAGFKDMRVIDRRKRLFFRAVLPMVLTVNESIANERAQLEAVRSRMRSEGSEANDLSEEDTVWLTQLAERYGIDLAEDDVTLSEAAEVLMKRVAPIPPALALAQAVEESAWGTSRFAREGNALFGQWVWNEDAGIVPEEQREGPDHAVRAFESPLQSVQGYARNLNTHWAYADFRDQRAAMLQAGQPLDSWELAKTLIRYSERREDYVKSLHAIMRVNNLRPLDQAKLASPDAMVQLASTDD